MSILAMETKKNLLLLGVYPTKIHLSVYLSWVDFGRRRRWLEEKCLAINHEPYLVVNTLVFFFLGVYQSSDYFEPY